MRSWQRPPVAVPDWSAVGWIVRAVGGVYGERVRVIVARETPYGLMVHRSIPCRSLDEARAVAAATTAEGAYATTESER